MNHYIYMITNNINKMKYIGKRSCDCKIENDSYMGGGTRLKKAQKELGLENFSKRILTYAFDEAMAFELENYYIKKADAVESNEYYNETYGGTGSSMFYHEDPERRRKVRETLSRKNKGKNLGANSGKAKKVICLNIMKIFDTEKEASESIGKNKGYVGSKARKHYRCLKNNIILIKCSAGIDSKTGESLYWLYYEDYEEYIKNHNKEIKIKDNNIYPDEKIICFNNSTIYNSMKEAIEVGGFKKEDTEYSYGLKITSAHYNYYPHCKLEWAYYSDYLDKTAFLKREDGIMLEHKDEKIICLNNNIVYESLFDASKSLCIPQKEIFIYCCLNESSKKLKYNDESYKFQFYSDYMK